MLLGTTVFCVRSCGLDTFVLGSLLLPSHSFTVVASEVMKMILVR